MFARSLSNLHRFFQILSCLRATQSTATFPRNSHVKDVLEGRLHNLVCAGKVDLKTAQQEIATGGLLVGVMSYFSLACPDYCLEADDSIRVGMLSK